MQLDQWSKFQVADLQSTALVIALFFIFWVFSVNRKQMNFKPPPGPKGFPVIGNLLSLTLHSEQQMNDWSKVHGPVCRLKFGTMEFVILGNMNAVKEAFVKKSIIFSDRLQNSMPGFSGDAGLAFINYGSLFKEQRHFAVSTLKMFGLGKRSLEPRILSLCVDLCRELDRYAGSEEPVDIGFAIYERVSAVISKLVCNKNLSEENKEFRQWLHDLHSGIENDSAYGITVLYPALKAIPPFRSWSEELVCREKKFFKIIQSEIEQHKITREEEEPRDFIDCFLQEIDDRVKEDGTQSNGQGFDENQLRYAVRDLFIGGSETTSTTLSWAVLFLCKYPRCQSTLQNEIDEVLQDRLPTTDEGYKLNYTKAVIQEVFRIRPVGPLGVPHVASKDATIMGYYVKKGTCVAPNIYRINHDESIWKEPGRFEPRRHLDESGKFVRNPNIIPYSIGARQCPGMQMANIELLLFLATIFQKFTFELEPDDEIDMRGKNIFALRPYPYKVLIKRR